MNGEISTGYNTGNQTVTGNITGSTRVAIGTGARAEVHVEKADFCIE
jgi:hypothetical protein